MAKKTEEPKVEKAGEEAEAEKVEEKVVEEKPKKRKGKVPKKKKKEKGLFKYYKIDENSLKRLLPFCERCGQGFFMADHGNRYTCGHCGFTRYKETQETRGAEA